MSTRRPAKVSRPPKPLVEACGDYYATIAEFADLVTSLRPTAAALILQGLFTMEPGDIHDVIVRVARRDFNLDKLEASARGQVETLRKAVLTSEQRQALAGLDDVSWRAGQAWGDAAYVLGIAVGLQLRPDVFNGGGVA